MSLYREAGARRNLAAAAIGVALVVGVAAGAVIGRATKQTPSLAEQMRDVQERTRPVVQGLDLVRLHVRTDRDAALAQAKRARDLFGGVAADLAAVDPAAAEAASRALDRTVGIAASDAGAAAVDRAAARAELAVRRAARLE